MSIPEYDEETLTKQNLIDLLNISDLCLLMIQTRGRCKESIEGNYFSGYDYNSLTREIGFLNDIQSVISKNILFRLKTETNLAPFESAEKRNEIEALSLDNYFLRRFFDKVRVMDEKYEIVKIAKQLFPNFDKCISEDWSFL